MKLAEFTIYFLDGSLIVRNRCKGCAITLAQMERINCGQCPDVLRVEVCNG